jgi:branched-subunit amino acid aminotransferase/4-amino-4-deoxychorismate lyase
VTDGAAPVAGMELDGEPVPAREVAALATSNYGTFTAMRVDAGQVLGLDLHLERLVRDSMILFGASVAPDRVRALLRRVADGCSGPMMLRATIFESPPVEGPAPGAPSPPVEGPSALIGRPTGWDDVSSPPVESPSAPIGRPTSRDEVSSPPVEGPSAPIGRPTSRDDVSAPPTDVRLRVLVTTRPVQPASAGGLRVRTVDHVRDLPRVKHIGLFAATHQRRLARQRGFDDALFVAPATGLVSEGPTWNLAVLIDGELVWPDDACLPGVTRALLHKVTADAGVLTSSHSLTRTDLAGARAAYATSAGIGLHSISEIDGMPLPGDEPLLTRLQQGYAALPCDQL